MTLRPHKITKLIGLPLVCLAMFAVAGGHWAVLQSVAWTTMLWDYSVQSGSLVTGAQQTFSGEYPCSLCSSVKDAKDKEGKLPQAVKADKKAEVFLVAFDLAVVLPVPKTVDFAADHVIFWKRSEAPPVPVPIVRA